MVAVFQFFFRTSKKQIFIIAAGSTISAFLNITSLRLLEKIINAELPDQLLTFGKMSFLLSTSAFLSIKIGKFGTTFFENRLALHRTELAVKILKTNFVKIQEKLDRIAPTLLFEMGELANFGKMIPTFLVSAIQVIAIGIYLFFLSWQMSLFVFCLFMFISFLLSIVLRKVKVLNARKSTVRHHFYQGLNLLIYGLKDLIVNASHGAHFVNRSVKKKGQELAQLQTSIHYHRIAAEQIVNAFTILMFAVSLITYLNVDWLVIDQKKAIQFVALFLFLVPSFIKIVEFLNRTKSAENALNQIEAIDFPPEIGVPAQEAAQSSHEQDAIIDLKEVSFNYDGNGRGFHLGPLNFSIAKGQVVVIQGGNGSGKTTLFNILSGLSHPTSGNLLYEGKDITAQNASDYRKHVGVFYTDTPVFDNLNYISDLSFDEAERLVEMLELSSKTSLKEGVFSKTDLSFGQKGRLSLIRILCEDKPIYMLDEWAANQDVYFKEKFYREIVPRLKQEGKTVVLITHDDRYFDIADQVIRLRNGKQESIEAIEQH